MFGFNLVARFIFDCTPDTVDGEVALALESKYEYINYETFEINKDKASYGSVVIICFLRNVDIKLTNELTLALNPNRASSIRIFVYKILIRLKLIKN